MQTERLRRSSVKLLLLDFGHPMTKETASSVKNALLNAVSLISAYSGVYFSTDIVISVMGTKCAVINDSNSLRKYYNDLLNCVNGENTNKIVNVKVTVQEYRATLRDSLNQMINKLTDVFSTKTLLSGKMNEKIKFIVVTKKTASLLNNILSDVINKMGQADGLDFTSLIKCKIIQITNEKAPGIRLNVNQKFDSYALCPDSMEQLNILFKAFIFKYKHQEIKIIISKDLDLIVYCDLCSPIIDPALMRLEFQLCNDFMFQLANKHSLLGSLSEVIQLNVLYRIPVSSLRPTLLFGITRQARATNSQSLNLNESQFNRQIFEALCQNLTETGEGLLVESLFEVESFPMKAFYFLISDGNTLLINCVVPEELNLSDLYSSSSECSPDECAILAMRTSLRQIPTLTDFNPNNFSCGLYERLRNEMRPPVRKQNASRTKQNYRRRKKLSSTQYKGGNYDETEKFTQNTCDIFRMVPKQWIDAVPQGKPIKKSKHDNIHPALLSPNTAEKYRKTDWVSYNLPELNIPQIDN